MNSSSHEVLIAGASINGQDYTDKTLINELDEDMAIFARILAIINLECLPGLASSVRQLEEDYPQPSDAATSLSCTVLSPPLSGGYHILFPLKFTDGTQWILEAPATGFPDQFDDFASRAFTCEAATQARDYDSNSKSILI